MAFILLSGGLTVNYFDKLRFHCYHKYDVRRPVKRVTQPGLSKNLPGLSLQDTRAAKAGFYLFILFKKHRKEPSPILRFLRQEAGEKVLKQEYLP